MPAEAIGPAAEEVRRRLLDQIGRGQLRPGERLGAERDLAIDLGVSRSTVRAALATLEAEGVQKFADSFTDLLDGIRAKREQLVAA